MNVHAIRDASTGQRRITSPLATGTFNPHGAVGGWAGRDGLIGDSPPMREAIGLVQLVANTDATVLLRGETGTGKELFARAVHQRSTRRAQPLVTVNCAALPPTLIEAELFGHERGAFTGALTARPGRFEIANRGTLFLDEIGELPLETQVKLLRVLQERTIERLGSPTPVAVDVRIIAATNRDLEAAVRAGTFRADLYYRLNVFPIIVPPLRERRADIPHLVRVLVDELGTTMRKRIGGVDRASLEALVTYDWPGNVRELRNVLERAMILASGPTLSVAPPQPPPAKAEAQGQAPQRASRELRDLERQHILHVLERTGWRIRGKGAAAEILGLKPTTLEARMERQGIRRPAGQQT